MLRHNRRAVAGFFEELPALIVVTAGLAIFLISVVHTFTVYATAQKNERFLDEAYKIERAVRSFSNITANGTYTGQSIVSLFDKEKLERVTTDDFLVSIHSSYKYNVTIQDKEGAGTWGQDLFGYGPSPPSTKTNYASAMTTVTLKVYNNEFHVAILTIGVW